MLGYAAAWVKVAAQALGVHAMAAMALTWQKVAPGVWRVRAGQDGQPQLLAAAGVAPRSEGLAQLGEAECPLARERIMAEAQAERCLLSVPLEPDEVLYGLGLNFKALEVQQSVRHLQVDHFGGQDNGRTHAPVPFYVSSRGYGVFVNAARYLSVYAGGVHRREAHPPVLDRATDPGWKAVQPGQVVEIAVPGTGVEMLLFAGPSLLQAVRRFNLFCGGGCLPPRWGLGFWHRVPLAFTAEQTEQLAAEFATRGYPLDVVGLEPGWHTTCYPSTFAWHHGRFPDPAAFIARLLDRGIRVNLWEHPYVAPDCDLARELADGCGTHTGSWGGWVPDLSLPAVRETILRQHEQEHRRHGVAGYKLDECDGFDPWLWPDHAQFPSGLSGEELRQIYGVLFQRLTTELYQRHNQRTYGLVRASNAGAVSFPYVLYSDCYSHRDFITALCSSSFCGVLWTPEARAARTAEEWVRRIQTTCLSPLAMINAWADGTMPWSFPEVADAVRDAMVLRQRLLPYLYSAFAQYQADGTPPFRAMVLEEGWTTTATTATGALDSERNPYALPELMAARDQYMMGPSLLVAPLFEGETERRVLLPPGAWYDFRSGALVGHGPGQVTVRADLATIPILVRDGGIVPLQAARRQIPTAGERVDLEIRHYGQADGSTVLYDDDGLSLDCERGEFCRLRLTATRSLAGTLAGQVETVSGRAPFTYAALTWRFMSAPA